ncbi:MAG: trypsin-like peptidase domain-containing protein [Candidatus Latescibacteria bacterium]|nr:trypsin-like peptidase domain-containing protein [Candidatus Latescibacterota bacterium]
MRRPVWIVLAGVFAALNLSPAAEDKPEGATPASAAGPQIDASRKNAIVRAVERVAPSVVGVTTVTLERYDVRYAHPFFDFFSYRGTVHEKRPGIGSGVVIRSDGYILTNYHVVEGAREITVTFSDGRSFKVQDTRKDVMVDPGEDLAVIRVNATDLDVPDLGDSEDVIIGEWAIAIGNPFGLLIEDPQPTVTAGVVSAVNRNLRMQQDEGGHSYSNMIQTDASINPGNSGGPLVNGVGQVIGINTFIFTKSGGSLGIGFAIPIIRAKKIADRLIAGGVQEFWAGFELHPKLTRGLANALGLYTHRAVLITGVADNSPASRAKLNPGDLIIAINGNPVRSAEDVDRILENAHVGDALALEIVRGRLRFATRLEPEKAPAGQQ